MQMSRLAFVLLAVAAFMAALPAAWAGGQKEHIVQTAPASGKAADSSPTATPIRHVVVIFDENVSFDHYFATYPRAANPSGESPFYPAPGTPAVNGLDHELLMHNPNTSNPKRLGPSQAMTADMDHGYTAEQKAFDHGLMDKFVSTVGRNHKIDMDYYDGNTVTALWYYAQHFAMSDNSFGTTFGPSSPGALNLVAGQTHGASAYSASSTRANSRLEPGQKGYPTWALNANGTLFSDVDPYFDESSKGSTIKMTGMNIGDLLDQNNLTWGWFQGGFAHPTRKHQNVGGHEVTDYIPHHEPFQYYKATANPDHLPPSSVAMIGHSDRANHQYGLADFWNAVDAGNLPAVSFLKAAGYEDGHAGYSDPIDEQRWIVDTINRLEKTPEWKNTAVFISWDDSDGWYDHVMSPVVRGSNDPAEDVLAGPGNAGKSPAGAYVDRAGYGPRLPLLVISPWARHNFVASSVSDQSSILRFIENNWKLGGLGNQSSDTKAGSLDNMFNFTPGYSDPKLFLSPTTGEPVAQTAPVEANGQLIMSVSDLAQSLDVKASSDARNLWFTFGGRLVMIPASGSTVSVDGRSVALGGRIRELDGKRALPVGRLASALGLQPVRLSRAQIVFKPAQASG